MAVKVRTSVALNKTITPDCKMLHAKPLSQWAGETSESTTKDMLLSKPANIDYWSNGNKSVSASVCSLSCSEGRSLS